MSHFSFVPNHSIMLTKKEPCKAYSFVLNFIQTFIKLIFLGVCENVLKIYNVVLEQKSLESPELEKCSEMKQSKGTHCKFKDLLGNSAPLSSTERHF